MGGRKAKAMRILLSTDGSSHAAQALELRKRVAR